MRTSELLVEGSVCPGGFFAVLVATAVVPTFSGLRRPTERSEPAFPCQP